MTGDKAKILSLVGADAALEKEIVVEGRWSSPDNINVHISSALVPSKKARVLAKELLQEEPFLVWIPMYGEYEDEDDYLRSDKKDFVPWIVCPYSEAKLDEYDPLGATCVMQRPYFAKNIITTFSLETDDPFGRIWKNSAGKPLAHSQAWGYESMYENETSSSGVRLLCSDELLRNVLTALDVDLLVLVNLQRYEKGIGYRDSRYSNTIAVIRIKKSLDFEFYKGAVDKIHQNRY